MELMFLLDSMHVEHVYYSRLSVGLRSSHMRTPVRLARIHLVGPSRVMGRQPEPYMIFGLVIMSV